ncbi:MarR family winged helix-turn-helix transcriptional regulator [Nonomuraea sp. B5E05]|uniref:MarR family winged helix-turn-helix transcriptional regulator n=1 Tax=Nonomuraea sp. B5E05 TaxID=3153569 RepID=UPI003261B5E8
MEPATTECVCTNLRMTTRWIDRIYNQALGKVGLRATGYAILSRVDAEGPITVSRLAGRMAMERTTCSREVELLTRAGLLQIEPGPDRRQRVVQLSPVGKDKLAEGRPHWEVVQERVAEAFGRQYTDDLIGMLRKLLADTEHLY